MSADASIPPPFAVDGRLGFGAGGAWAGTTISDEVADNILRTAFACGVRYFDTGPTYGGGRAETRLGRFAKVTGDLVLSTKVGTHFTTSGRLGHDYSPSAIRSSLDSSLARLGRTRVDLLFLHGPNTTGELATETVDAMVMLREEGVVGAIGASCDGEVARKVVQSAAFDVLMTTFNVLSPAAAGIAEEAHRRGMTVIAKSPLAHAPFSVRSLAPTNRRRAWYLARLLRNYRRDLAHGLRAGRTLRSGGDAAAPTALRYVLSKPFISAAVIGTTRTDHLKELVSAAKRPPLEPQLIQQLEEWQGRHLAG